MSQETMLLYLYSPTPKVFLLYVYSKMSPPRNKKLGLTPKPYTEEAESYTIKPVRKNKCLDI